MLFADLETAKSTVAMLYPDSTHTTVIDEGYDNIVILVDKLHAVRFPRNMRAYMRDKYEEGIIQSLSSPVVEVKIPIVLCENIDPTYFITDVMPGEHLSTNDVLNLSEEKQFQIADEIAAFAFALHSKITPELVKELRSKNGIDAMETDSEESWGVYFTSTLRDVNLPSAEQNAIAKRFFEKWSALPRTKEVAIHDDLHLGNMLFENGKLTGVLDFGDTSVGTPEQELRQLYRIHRPILERALATYGRLSGSVLSVESSIIWAVTQELAAYSDRLARGETGHPSYLRAAQNLQKWFPERKWISE